MRGYKTKRWAKEKKNQKLYKITFLNKAYDDVLGEWASFKGNSKHNM